jgi:hypothetical protein
MQNIAAQRALALANLQQATALLDQVDSLLASAILVLEEDGAYMHTEASDVCAAVREEIHTVTQLVSDYVN